MPFLDVDALVRFLSTNKHFLQPFVTQALHSSNQTEWFDQNYWTKLYTTQASYRCALTHIVHPSTLDVLSVTQGMSVYEMPPYFMFYRYAHRLNEDGFEYIYKYAKKLRSNPFVFILHQADIIFQNKHTSNIDLNKDMETAKPCFNVQVNISSKQPSSCLVSQLKDQFEHQIEKIIDSSDSDAVKRAFLSQHKIGNLILGSLDQKIKQPALEFLSLNQKTAEELLEKGEGDRHDGSSVSVVTPRFCTTCGTWMLRPRSKPECKACLKQTVFTSPDVVRVCVQVCRFSGHACSFRFNFSFQVCKFNIPIHISLFSAGP